MCLAFFMGVLAMAFRQADEDDFDALGQLMFDSVHADPSPYTVAQRTAWVSEPKSGAYWRERLLHQIVWLSETNGQIEGFMTLIQDTGYIDLAFIRSEARGRGLFRELALRIEDAAREAGRNRVWTHASLMAEPAFARMGFSMIEREEITMLDQVLVRFLMEKRL